ncbi:MAG: phage integrase SAM-like domain and Arm DNA-binding domain-containing protein, partial [Bacteroides sp.]|nr:phage integrase SAM-like domain and Arm DNA-binding domain-containing protein [Bacteroides sp.]
MKQNTFKVLFVLRRNHVNKDGKCAIIVRVTVNGEQERINSTLDIEPELWDSQSGKAIGRTAKIMAFNKRLDDIKYVLQNHYHNLLNAQGYVTAKMVKNAYMGITAKEESLIPIYDEFLAETKKMVGINRSDKTYQKYERCKRRVVEFMKKKYNISDIPLKELKPKFLSDFEVFLATEYQCKQNTIYKFLQLFRMVLV